MVIGTAGHIDHGKSALVAALTGVHPDRLPEEKRRGMTLDLGFGHLALDGVVAGIVDVPGHEKFVRTMLAGASGIDVALLVVAADAGVQPQTREHFQILLHLAIPRAIIALAKSDLASPSRRQEVWRQVDELLAHTALAAAPRVETSVRTGAGLDALRLLLAQAAQSASARDRQAPFRLPVDRVFTLAGFGTVATGTLVQGIIASDAEIALPGDPRRLRLRGLQVHGQPAASAVAGQRVALNLAGIADHELHRGAVLAPPNVFVPTRVLDVVLSWPAATSPPRHRSRFRFHLHTAERVATLLWLLPPKSGKPAAQETAYAQLRLDQPVIALPGDRFILRHLSPALTFAGGRVLDNQPPLHRPAAYAAAAAFLAQIAAANPLESILLHLGRAQATGLPLAQLAAHLGCRASDLQPALTELVRSGQIVLSRNPPAAVLASLILARASAIVAALGDFHAHQPLVPSASPEQLRLSGPVHWDSLAFAALLRAGKIEFIPPHGYRLPGCGVILTPAQRTLCDRLEARFRQAALAIPPLPQLLAEFPQPEARSLLQSLLRAGTLVQLQPALILHTPAWTSLKQMLHARRPVCFGVTEFKQWTGLSRKFAIPLLECLDQHRVTRRLGDQREIL